MTQLLVFGQVILAKAPIADLGDDIVATDIIFQKSTIPGWQILDLVLPDDFSLSEYGYINSALTKLPPDSQFIATMRQAKINAITEKFIERMNIVFGKYCQYEINTFPNQQRDYDAWVINNTAPTPFVDAMLATSAVGVTKASIMTNIGKKSSPYANFGGNCLGYKQNKLAAILAADDAGVIAFDPLAGWP